MFIIISSALLFQAVTGQCLVFAIKKSSIPRDAYFAEKDGLAYYYKTIYLRRDAFFLCVANEAHQKLILADASPSIEVKTIDKYLHFKGRSSFLIIATEERFNQLACTPQLYYPDQLLLNKRSDSQPYFDRAFNQIKGLLYGLLLGTVGGKKETEIALEKSLQELQNEIIATRGRIELTENYTLEAFTPLMLGIEHVAGNYRKVYGKEHLQPFELLRNYIAELKVYTEQQKNAINEQRKGYRQQSPENSDELIRLLEEERVQLAQQQDAVDIQLKKMKERLKACGRSTVNEALRQELKSGKEHLQDLKKELRERFSLSGKKINSLQFKKHAGPQRGRTDFDGNIDDIYSKISNLVTRLAFSRRDDFTNRKRTRRGLELHHYQLDIQKLTRAYFQHQKIITETLFTAYDPAAYDDGALFALIINQLLLLARGTADPTEAEIDSLLTLIYAQMVEKEHTQAAMALQQLQRYRLERSFEYILPNENEVLRGFIAFIFKPNSLEELQRFMFNKDVGCHYIAYCFWGAFNGFARLPKTFTNSIFNTQNETLLDAIDDYLFDTYLMPSSTEN